MEPDALERSAELTRSARSITVLTGAGISTESGIPDFRGPKGIWTKDPSAAALSHIDTYVSDPAVRRRAWQARRIHPAWSAEPNIGHQALVDLERQGRLRALVTQNIDGLHQKAGSTGDMVIEVHGTLHWVVCLGCGLRTPMAEVIRQVEDGDEDPPCPDCGGIQKSDTISFGQSLKEEVLDAACRAADECDLFLAVGTTLTVHPVAGLCGIALKRGTPLVIINAEPTPYDKAATAILRDPIGRVLPVLVGQ